MPSPTLTSGTIRLPWAVPLLPLAGRPVLGWFGGRNTLPTSAIAHRNGISIEAAATGMQAAQ
jgi:hypothetical protein